MKKSVSLFVFFCFIFVLANCGNDGSNSAAPVSATGVSISKF